MNKPIKPHKKTEIKCYGHFYFDHVSNKVSLDDFLSWVKETVPKGGYDVCLSLHEEFGDEMGEMISANILLSWKQKAKNTRYVSEMKKYEKAVKEWKKQCRKK